MNRKILVRNDSESNIKALINIIIFCSAPPFCLVAFIVMMSSIFNSHNTNNLYILVMFQQSIPIFIAYGLIPCIIFKIYFKKPLADIGFKNNKHYFITIIDICIVGGFIAFLLFNKILNTDVGIYVIHYLFVAFSEELLVRGIILYLLEQLFYKEWMSILLSAIIFSLIFHSTDGVLLNLVYRVPFGVITAILYKKTNSLTSPIILHWLYNVLLSI